MHFSSVSLRLVWWIRALSILVLLSQSSFGQVEVQNWLDSLASLIDSYDDLVSKVAHEPELKADQEISVACTENDRRQTETRIDCLANLLLAEEYQPYDFDIRETMWCKGWSCGSLLYHGHLPSVTLNQLLREEAEIANEQPVFVQPLPEFAWLKAVRSQVWKGFESQLRSDWEFVLIHIEQISVPVEAIAASFQRQLIENRIASRPNLRETFGHSVLPKEIKITSEEYATMMMQIWMGLRASDEANSVLSQSTWYQLRSTSLEPFYDLLTSIPRIWPITHR